LALTGSRSKIIYRPLPVDDPKQRQPDISLANEKLGWTPKVPLDVGLERTIAYFDKLLNGTVKDLRRVTA
jgi:UDP-glucuronate decarboxylase